MATGTRPLTADDLLAQPDDGARRELVRGEVLTIPPSGLEHSAIGGRLAWLVGSFVVPRRLGTLFTADAGFIISRNPDTVRSPDFAFVTSGRFPEERVPKTFGEFAPDLVAEVVSPSDAAPRVEEKVHDWLRAGVRLVWVVYPSTRSVTVYRSLTEIRILTDSDALDGYDVLPGFTCPVKDLFPA